jgi:hypothetical protein
VDQSNVGPAARDDVVNGRLSRRVG